MKNMSSTQAPQQQTRSLKPRLPRRGLGLSDKLGLTICLILVFSISLSSLLNYFNFQRTYEDLIRSSYTIMLRDISYSIQYGLGLGLSLPSMDNIPALIRQTQASEQSIDFIKVFDTRGEILFHTRPERIGDQAPAAWRTMVFNSAQTESIWSSRTERHYLIGLPLINNFDLPEGALLLAYTRAESTAVFSDVQRQLIKQSGMVIAAFGVFSLLCAFLVFRGLSASLRRAERLLRQTITSDDNPVNTVDDGGELERELGNFRAMLRDVKRELEGEQRGPTKPPEDKP